MALPACVSGDMAVSMALPSGFCCSAFGVTTWGYKSCTAVKGCVDGVSCGSSECTCVLWHSCSLLPFCKAQRALEPATVATALLW